MLPYILIGNYGNETIALMQWLIEAKLTKQATIVSIDTGWAAESWMKRVQQAEAYAKQNHFTVVRLTAPASFSVLVQNRRSFPSQKFQWCAAMLKGVTINAWLDEIDPLCEATILLGKWHSVNSQKDQSNEFIEQSEHYNQRKVWYPLFHCDAAQCKELIQRAGFALLTHRSLECDPCIHNTKADFNRITQQDIAKTAALEQEIGQTMFPLHAENGYNNIVQLVANAQNGFDTSTTQPTYGESRDMGCGSPWSCGE